MTQHQGKQPDYPNHLGVIPEPDLEVGKVYLPLVSGGRFKPHLITGLLRWPDGAQVIGQDRVSARVPLCLYLPQKPRTG